jgi:hypothetical protein
MDRSAFLNRFLTMLLLLAAAALAGCSGSSDVIPGEDDDEAQAPVEQPGDDPSDDPADSGSEPSVHLTAADSVVPAGGTASLTWSSQNVGSCNASGGWSGAKPRQGSATVGPLSRSTTFTLTCSGDGGNAVAMLSVSVLGVVTLEWQPPTDNVDGTPLNDLEGFRIYYGQFSRSYTDDLQVVDGRSTGYELSLPSGSYYFAMTALDADGNESAYSNEVVKVVN